MLASLGLGKKPVDPAEQLREWKRGITREVRHLERDIKALEREEQKSQKECQQLAKKDKKAAMIVAKSIVQARRAKEKMYMTRASMNTMVMQINSQAAMVKAAGCLEKSTVVMTSLNEMMRVGKLSDEMRKLAREMEKAGFIEEVMNEGLEDVFGDSELDTEADAEVNKVMDEILSEQFAGTSVPDAQVSAPAAAIPGQAEEVTEGEEDELAAMRDRLQAL